MSKNFELIGTYGYDVEDTAAYEEFWGDEPEGDDYAEEDAYYHQPRTVVCCVCTKQETDTHRNLVERKQWGLGPQEFCPSCAVQQKFWDAALQLGRCQMLNDSIKDSGKPIDLDIICPF